MGYYARMSEKPPRKKRMMTEVFEERVTYYDSVEGMKLLQRIARERSVGLATALRQLVREEIKRLDREERT
jgi:hypothetical protein